MGRVIRTSGPGGSILDRGAGILVAMMVLCGAVHQMSADELARACDGPVDTLRVLTYNVLAEEGREAELRVPVLLQIMRDADADVIALQEVAPWFARILLNEAWVRPYHRAMNGENTIVAHEHIILSRFPVREHHQEKLPGKQGRELFSVTLDVDGMPTVVATCHLDSLLGDGKIRAAQLDAFFGHLAPHAEAMLLGDFNFGDGERPETGRIPTEFRDAWLVVHPGVPGFTWDISKSRMARRESFQGEGSRRIDRILFKTTRWKAVEVTILGDAPVTPKRRDVFPSDHFGLLAVYRRAEPVGTSGSGN